MKILALVLGVLLIPRYLAQSAISTVVAVILYIWLFNLTDIFGAAADPLMILINFFRYGLNETSVLILLISVATGIYATIKSYLYRSMNQDLTLAWLLAAAILVAFTGLGLPIGLSLIGVNQFGGISRIFTDVMLVLALALSVYSVGWAGAQIELAYRGKN